MSPQALFCSVLGLMISVVFSAVVGHFPPFSKYTYNFIPFKDTQLDYDPSTRKKLGNRGQGEKSPHYSVF